MSKRSLKYNNSGKKFLKILSSNRYIVCLGVLTVMCDQFSSGKKKIRINYTSTIKLIFELMLS